jgi:hypothetical protein
MYSTRVLERLAEAKVAQARAEAKVLNLMVEYADAAQDEAELEESRSRRGYLTSVIADEIAAELGCSVHWVQQTLARTRLARAKLPQTWAAFQAGQITAHAIREIGRHTSRLERDESFEKIDVRLAGYAFTHTTSETSSWVKRRVQTLEPWDATAREKNAERDRRVSFSYDEENGGGSMWLSLPTRHMLEVERAVRASLEAKASDDERTVDQFLSDEARARLTQDADGTSLVATEVVITVPVTTLAGLDDTPGATLDERVLLPAEVVRELASQTATLFHRAVTDPYGGILDVTRLGRFFTGDLRTAIKIRDGKCTVPWCNSPTAEIDHITPWPEGPTNAANGHGPCKRHHQLKTAGVLAAVKTSDQGVLWVLPSGRSVPSHRANHPPAPTEWFPLADTG